MNKYAYPEILVDAQWVDEHLQDSGVRLVELGATADEYNRAHLPGAVFWNVLSDIVQANNHYRTIFDQTAFKQLMSRSGIHNDTTVVFYSSAPVYAAWGLWYVQLLGHKRARVMQGGRQRWVAEGRPLVDTQPAFAPTDYQAQPPDNRMFMTCEQVQAALGKPTVLFLDVRSPQEYHGELFWKQPAQKDERAGHLPGAVNVNYEATLREDGDYLSAEDLRVLFQKQGVTGDKTIVTYCTFGGRSAQMWFVLKYLLGYEDVRSYAQG